ATSLTPDSVVDVMSDYYKNHRATVNRATYETGQQADGMYNDARSIVAGFINANPDEIVFTKGTTAALNNLARNLVPQLNKGDEILTNELEHHANFLPWIENGKLNDVDIKFIDLIDNAVTLESVEKAVTNKTRIITLNHVSNIIGATNDIAAIGKFCQDKNIIFVVDGAQGITHEQVDVKTFNCDFYVFSGHKLFGPTGIGVLFGKQQFLEKMVFDYGGDMAALVTKEGYQKKDAPLGLEAGTPSIAEVIGMGEAIKYFAEFDIEDVKAHIHQLKQYTVEQLQKIPEVEIYNAQVLGGTVAFNIVNFPVHDALTLYSNYGVAMRGGHMCNQLTINLLKQSAILRISFNVYNSKEDIDKFIEVTNIILKGDELSWMDF
ncbi:MAG: aminotransferase class V-fold PLP-dependent enzyme, partial [Spiroplasma sp.]|nr:aminotransferase class V-fold PLP-dependent enzyme [Mycoplasmatales bacterium]